MFDGALYQEPQVVRDLREARKVLARGWTRNAQARNESGVGVEALDPYAVSWCLGGAVLKATGTFFWRDGKSAPAMNLLDRETLKRGSRYGLAAFNNNSVSVEDVYGLIDAAIETALAQEAAHV